MPSVAKWMVGYGLFLILCGVGAWAVAWGLSGEATRGLSGLIAGGAAAVLIIIPGLLSAAKNQKARMIGIHAGLVVLALLVIGFAYQAVVGWMGALGEDGGPMYVPATITLMAIGGIVTLVMVLRLRPPMEKRGGGVEGDPLE